MTAKVRRRAQRLCFALRSAAIVGIPVLRGARQSIGEQQTGAIEINLLNFGVKLDFLLR